MRSDDIVYFNNFPGITRRSLLYKTGVEYGDYTINHILGCAHGCQYPCYAMQISKRYGRISDYEDWMHPRLVSNSLEILDKELPKLNSHMSFIHLSFMTDPFMYDAVNSRSYSWIQDLTLKIIKRLNEEDLKVTVLTKGLYPSKLSDKQFSKGNEYGITLVSLDSEFHEKYEPYSAPPKKRLEALKDLHESGLPTWISIEPYPTPNIVEQDLDDLLQSVSFVDKVIFGRWNYNPEVNGHDGVVKFYRASSKKVTDFCRKNDIVLHIKHGTPMSNAKSNGLFHE
ncbi:MAG: radical SAM protein [Candidatus Thorarchaeota archaeon]|nr:MAG: radical SAM protein [Candidatus Thorarchaeota archaeon]